MELNMYTQFFIIKVLNPKQLLYNTLITRNYEFGIYLLQMSISTKFKESVYVK